jgi:hypothetical protein
VADTCTNGQDATMSTTIATIKLIGRYHDCQVLTKLLNQAGGSHTFERRLLALDYQVMNVCYQLTRTNDLSRARNARAEIGLNPVLYCRRHRPAGLLLIVSGL